MIPSYDAFSFDVLTLAQNLQYIPPFSHTCSCRVMWKSLFIRFWTFVVVKDHRDKCGIYANAWMFTSKLCLQTHGGSIHKLKAVHSILLGKLANTWPRILLKKSWEIRRHIQELVTFVEPLIMCQREKCKQIRCILKESQRHAYQCNCWNLAESRSFQTTNQTNNAWNLPLERKPMHRVKRAWA